jgi:hypothetical protein
MNTNDIVAGIDPTAFSSITGAQLLTMVDLAQPSSDRGFVLVTTDNIGVPVIPDAGNNTQWQRYLWLRFSPLTASFTVNAWNVGQTYNMPYSNGTGTTVATFWTPLTSGSIPANSIAQYQLNLPTITSLPYLTGITFSQITGGASIVTTSTSLVGAVTGAIGATVILPNTITGSQILADGVTGIATANINTKAVTVAKILGGTNGQVMMTTDGTTDAGWVNKSILGAAEPASANQAPVSSGAGAYTLVSSNSSSFGKVLQVVQARSSVSSFLAGGATATQIITSALPAIQISGGAFTAVSTKSGFILDGLTSGNNKIPLAISLTPLSSNSKLRIKLSIPVLSSAGATSNISAAIYNLNPANAVVTAGAIAYAGTVGSPTNINPMTDSVAGSVIGIKTTFGSSSASVLEFEWLVTPAFAYGATAYAAGTAMTLVAAIGSNGTDSLGINSSSTSAATALFAAGALAAVLSVEEIIV